jgi:DNA-binding MarR family transcriptional regulator
MKTGMGKGELTSLAREIEGHLRAVRQKLRRPIEAEFARGHLTGPQLSVMEALVHSEGLSLKELGGRQGMAHSTVSGIVDRLAKRGLVERLTNPTDRRSRTIVVSRRVRDYMRDVLPALTIHPIAAALRRAKPAERSTIAAGLRILRRVVEAGS